MKILTDVQLVEQVSELRYLGSLMSEDGYCEKEITTEQQWERRYSWTGKDCSQAN